MNELSRLRESKRYGACADDSVGCREPFSAKHALWVKGRSLPGSYPHTRPQAGDLEANRRLRRLLGRR